MTLINKIFIGIGAALVLITAIAIIWLWLADAHLRVRLATVQRDSIACHIANDNFAASVVKQNKAVAALQKQALARETKAKLVSYRAQLAARRWFLAADKIEKQKITGDQCRAAEQMIDDHLGRAK